MPPRSMVRIPDPLLPAAEKAVEAIGKLLGYPCFRWRASIGADASCSNACLIIEKSLIDAFEAL